MWPVSPILQQTIDAIIDVVLHMHVGEDNMENQPGQEGLSENGTWGFIPKGNDILVASSVHLIWEALDRYTGDFHTMVRNVSGVTGQVGVEVLLVVPMVRKGIDLHDWKRVDRWCKRAGAKDST